MNKKAQTMTTLGGILVMFIMVLVGVILFQAVAQEAGKGSATVVSNGTVNITVPASGATIDLTGQELLSTPTVYNSTYHQVTSSNWTIDEGVSDTTGVKSVQYTNDADIHTGESVTVEYTYGADGYIDNSGARAMASLIAIFFALAIAIIALEPTLRSGVIDMVNR